MRKLLHITPEMACAEFMYITVPNEIDIEMNCSYIDAPPALHKGITIDLLSQLMNISYGIFQILTAIIAILIFILQYTNCLKLMKISYGIFQILTSINIILISILNNSLIFDSFQ